MEYQRRRTKYLLPKALYNQMIWRIRDYNRLKEWAYNLIQVKGGNAGIGSNGSYISDRVANAVIKREKLLYEINSIDKAFNTIPEEYRQGVWDNIQSGKSYPLTADRSTYGRYKTKAIYMLAEELGLYKE